MRCCTLMVSLTVSPKQPNSSHSSDSNDTTLDRMPHCQLEAPVHRRSRYWYTYLHSAGQARFAQTIAVVQTGDNRHVLQDAPFEACSKSDSSLRLPVYCMFLYLAATAPVRPRVLATFAYSVGPESWICQYGLSPLSLDWAFCHNPMIPTANVAVDLFFPEQA